MVLKKLEVLAEVAQGAVSKGVEIARQGFGLAYQAVDTILEQRRNARDGGSSAPQQAESCPFSGGASAEAKPAQAPDFAAAAAAGVCPFTGQRADGTIPDAAPVEEAAAAPAAKTAKAEAPKPAAKAEAPKSAAAKAEEPKPKKAEAAAEAKPSAKAEPVKASAPKAKAAAPKAAKEAKPATPRKASAKPSVTPAPAARLGSELDNLEEMSRDELYKLATELDIKGRKDKKKEWLIPAIRQATQQG